MEAGQGLRQGLPEPAAGSTFRESPGLPGEGLRGGLRRRVRRLAEVVRVLAEVVDRDPATAAGTALALLEEIGGGRVPVLPHGEDGGAWPVLRTATELGLDTRVGLEDVLHHPDGSLATGNAGLVRSAKRVMRSVIVR